MVFSSPVFLFIFFPLFYILYFLLPRRWRNGFILAASLGFYLLGAGALTLVALLLLLMNWLLAGAIGRIQNKPESPRTTTLMAVGIAINLAPLLFFKYLVFFAGILSDISGIKFLATASQWGIALPLGISFYTFHFLSYLIDVYQGRIAAERSLQKFAIYIFLFPHLIAGPVVRFSEVKQQLDPRRRQLVWRNIFWGLIVFIVGLAKKILIADPLGAVVDQLHGHSEMLTTYSAWIGAFCYSFQIYFDFSGYTDMAIGMARMMGFRFPRNFHRPYAATSVTEFWQRWHMSLSRWFRDYVYIPLGGNRTTTFKVYRNLFVVFILCALWHGAAYTFLLWGVGHGILIALERCGLLRTERLRLGGVPVFLLATILWVPFRADDLKHAWQFWRVMFGLDAEAPVWIDNNRMLADPKIIFLMLLSGAICLVSDRLFYRWRGRAFRRPALAASYCLLLYILSCMSVVEHGFNPFIYFQF